MWMILSIIGFILFGSIVISILILKTIENQPNWLMNMSFSSSTNNETETSSSGVTSTQSGSIPWQQDILNHIQEMGYSTTEPELPTSNGGSTSASNKKKKKDKKPTNRFELMDLEE